jgi:hypothetical protein
MENTTIENDMKVFKTFFYEKQKVGDKKIINGDFQILRHLGSGAFWNVSLVQRNINTEETNDNNFYVFKEGSLSKIDGDAYDLILMKSKSNSDFLNYEGSESKFISYIFYIF